MIKQWKSRELHYHCVIPNTVRFPNTLKADVLMLICCFFFSSSHVKGEDILFQSDGVLN